MRRIFLLLLLVNFALFQIMGAYLVHDAAARMDNQREIAVTAGYGPLPLPASLSMSSSMAGGLFYSLSLGIGLTMLEAAAAFLLVRIGPNPASSSVLFGLASAGVIYYLSGPGKAARAATVFCCLSFAFAVILIAVSYKKLKKRLSRRAWARAVLIAILIAAAGYFLGVRNFTAVRDQLFLTNGPGRAVSDFYYENTVNATRPLESPAQRAWLLAGARRDSFGEKQWHELESKLLAQAVFLVPQSAAKEKTVFDVVVEKQDGAVFLGCASNGSALVALSADPAGDLEALTRDCDPARKLRMLLALCVGLACPLAVLLAMAWALGWCWERISGRWGRGGCIIGGTIGVACIAVFLFFGFAGPLPEKEPVLVDLALHGNVFERGRAARAMAERAKRGVAKESLLTMAGSGDPRVRGYAARGLAFASGPEVLQTLIDLSRDEQIFVARSAVFGLSHQPGPAGRARLADLCRNDPRPYVSYIAFKDLKSRGWLEKGS